jgi:hypothetical protein
MLPLGNAHRIFLEVKQNLKIKTLESFLDCSVVSGIFRFPYNSRYESHSEQHKLSLSLEIEVHFLTQKGSFKNIKNGTQQQ